MTRTQSYLEVFSRFKQRESVQAVERILAQQTNLVAFEKSQLGTLPPTLFPGFADANRYPVLRHRGRGENPHPKSCRQDLGRRSRGAAQRGSSVLLLREDPYAICILVLGGYSGSSPGLRFWLILAGSCRLRSCASSSELHPSSISWGAQDGE